MCLCSATTSLSETAWLFLGAIILFLALTSALKWQLHLWPPLVSPCVPWALLFSLVCSSVCKPPGTICPFVVYGCQRRDTWCRNGQVQIPSCCCLEADLGNAHRSLPFPANFTRSKKCIWKLADQERKWIEIDWWKCHWVRAEDCAVTGAVVRMSPLRQGECCACCSEVMLLEQRAGTNAALWFEAQKHQERQFAFLTCLLQRQ